ncbi:MAG TPA: hypothetical protein DEH02_10810 [Bacteroidales bacterium]|nr:MAG: hypothetical protein A2X01_14770 [Bacteroidetes bacterium GWF2_35_48]OFY92481.1 MAG: hypothetical protein A2491_10730 [Bacteroidetes bacterium RIFOXYC12_FULL_35_7]HBX51544.1 hypothetical protein [Bacteroidales bacterium]
MEKNQSELKTEWIFGFAVDCPAQINDINCPFHAIRKLPLRERYEFIKKMSDDDVRSFMFSHTCCHHNKQFNKSQLIKFINNTVN